MSKIAASSNIKQAEIVAVVRRADGTVQHFGTVAYYHRNPLKRFAWAMKRWLSR